MTTTETAKTARKAKNYMMSVGASDGLGRTVGIILCDGNGKRILPKRKVMCAGLVGDKYIFVEQVIENLNGSRQLVGFVEWDEDSMYSEWKGGYEFEICPRDKPELISEGNPKQRTELAKEDLEHILKLWRQRKH